MRTWRSLLRLPSCKTMSGTSVTACGPSASLYSPVAVGSAAGLTMGLSEEAGMLGFGADSGLGGAGNDAICAERAGFGREKPDPPVGRVMKYAATILSKGMRIALEIRRRRRRRRMKSRG